MRVLLDGVEVDPAHGVLDVELVLHAIGNLLRRRDEQHVVRELPGIDGTGAGAHPGEELLLGLARSIGIGADALAVAAVVATAGLGPPQRQQRAERFADRGLVAPGLAALAHEWKHDGPAGLRQIVGVLAFLEREVDVDREPEIDLVALGRRGRVAARDPCELGDVDLVGADRRVGQRWVQRMAGKALPEDVDPHTGLCVPRTRRLTRALARP